MKKYFNVYNIQKDYSHFVACVYFKTQQKVTAIVSVINKMTFFHCSKEIKEAKTKQWNSLLITAGMQNYLGPVRLHQLP